jgi:alpha-amylase
MQCAKHLPLPVTVCLLLASACGAGKDSTPSAGAAGGSDKDSSPSAAGGSDKDSSPSAAGAAGGSEAGSATLNPANTYVEMFKWRWPDIATECTDFLGPKGFGAVQVSPPMESIALDAWYDMYQPVNYDVLVSDMGNQAQFAAMIKTCHAAGVRIYVDAVLNHQASGQGTGTGGSSYNGNTLEYPLFGPADFHPDCTIQPSDYDDDRNNVVNCRLDGLPDLATDQASIRTKLAAYLSSLLAMGVDGFRLDSAKHMWPSDVESYLGQAPARTLLGEPVFVTQEIVPDETVVRSDYFPMGTINEFEFTYAVRDAFRKNNDLDISQLPAMVGTGNGGGSYGLEPSANVTDFVDNHDTVRSQTDSLNPYQDGKSFDLAIIFMLGFPYGIAQIESDFIFTFANTNVNAPAASPYDANGNALIMIDWDFVHRWPDVYPMVAFRNATQGQPMTNVYKQQVNALAFSCGNVGFVALNSGSSPWQATLPTGLPAGTYCNIVHGLRAAGGASCAADSVTVDASGNVALDIPALGGSVVPAVAIYTGQKVSD